MKNDTGFVSIYKDVELITSRLVRDIGLDGMMPTYNVPSMLLNKVGGYNCSLEGIIRHIRMSDWHSVLYRVPVVRGVVASKYIKNKDDYETVVSDLLDKSESRIMESEAYYFCSMEKYSSVLIAHADDSFGLKGSTFILPNEAVEWASYKSIAKSGANVFFLSEFGLSSQELNQASAEVSQLWSKNRKKLKNIMVHNGVDYTKFLLPILKHFVTNFCVYHIALGRKISSIFSPKGRPVFIARNRRAIENLISQLSQSQGSKVTMVLHGVLTSDYDRWQLFTSNYGSIDEVIVFGKQQKKAIEKKQNFLGQSVPKISIQSKYFIATLLNNKSKRSKFLTKEGKARVLLIGQKFNDNYLAKLSTSLSSRLDGKCDVYFRPHPINLKSYSDLKLESSERLAENLHDYDVVLSHSSTALFEAAIIGSLVVVLDFDVFNRIYSNPLSEVKSDRPSMIVKTNDQLFSLLAYIANRKNIEKIKEENKKWLEYFVRL